jgi:hypothetical protein
LRAIEAEDTHGFIFATVPCALRLRTSWEELAEQYFGSKIAQKIVRRLKAGLVSPANGTFFVYMLSSKWWGGTPLGLLLVLIRALACDDIAVYQCAGYALTEAGYADTARAALRAAPQTETVRVALQHLAEEQTTRDQVRAMRPRPDPGAEPSTSAW